MAAIAAYRDYGKTDATQTTFETRLALLASLYTGSWTADDRWPWAGIPDLIYRNSRQIVKHTSSIVDLYEQLVYFGELPPPSDVMNDVDISDSAIPILPETNNEAKDRQQLIAYYTLFQVWQWQMWMALIPKTAAIFGDVFVELIDDPKRGIVSPEIVYPGYIPTVDLELDHAGNVKRYAKEYHVVRGDSTAFGKPVKAETYLFRKEVDGDSYRWYRDGKPAAFPEQGIPNAVAPNPYGFVPACLFRHELVIGSKRGMGAYEKTVSQAVDLNSTLSSATDYQRKQFGMPIGVIGSSVRAGSTITMPGGITLGKAATPDEVLASKRVAAEMQNFLPLAEGGSFVTAQFDIADTMEMVTFVHDKLISENPEAQYGQRLAELSTATGPGVRMQLAPIRAKAQAAQRTEDPQMLKLAQMGTAMMGFRLNRGDIPRDLVSARPDRYDAFRPFDLTSFGKGLLDARIPLRDPFPESQAEKAAWLAMVADLPAWGLRELGIDEKEIAAMEADRQAARAEMAAALSVAGAGGTGEIGTTGPTAATGPSGPTARTR